MDAQTLKHEPTHAEIKDVLLRTKGISAKMSARDGYYRVDRRNAAEYLWSYPKWERLICNYFAELKAADKPVVYVDICGRANASSLGAEVNYSFSLQPLNPFRKDSNSEVRIRGDLFSAKDFYSFINLLRSTGEQLALVTFEPIVGLQSYSPPKDDVLASAVTFKRLENNLRKMLELMRPGGFIFLECPFQFMNIGDWFRKKPVKEYETSKWVADFCKHNKCSLRIDRSIVGPRYLLRKRGARKKQKN